MKPAEKGKSTAFSGVKDGSPYPKQSLISPVLLPSPADGPTKCAAKPGGIVTACALSILSYDWACPDS